MAGKVYPDWALKEFSRQYPQLHTDLWIDDLSFDVVDRDPRNAVGVALQAFEFIKKQLEMDHLKISEKKTGSVVSNVEAKRMLKDQLSADRPKVHDVMRDLGVDCTAVKGRRSKAARKSRKNKKLNVLKIPMKAVWLKRYKGSILAGVSWGHQAMGLAPQVRRRIQTAIARQMGMHKTADRVFDMQPRHR